ncbi:predicted protein [Nematostella vectensis]|uniref:Uncharacterized protein n=1 Tax=Nematostella vectensis TaxID=45351 RepID=A7S6V1_NEMVE|nr:uncharacterized protein LOC5512343 [Nematostella vectensis]EDO40622.1 predicted protein [Nematostella vectensis]|eukprot:XP_001632685.1 predicted protein [Nematostella vectensis]
MKIVLFADFVATSHGLTQAQYVLKHLCEQGHCISLFECSDVSVPILIYEEPSTVIRGNYEEPLHLLERKVVEADAILLVTDRETYDTPKSLISVKKYFRGCNYAWKPYGINCLLLGGSVHSRKVAMALRSLLEGSDYMSGCLPHRCSWTEMYSVDASLETPGPCVL